MSQSTQRRAASSTWDVVILGGGLAGLTLARHLLLETDKRVLILERRDELPQARQKVGESSVQLAGWYFSKVLGMEAHLMHEHFMKYNLRFYWPSSGEGRDFEDYSAAYIRPFSNIASFQLDRNVFEGELLRVNEENERFRCERGVEKLNVELTEGEAPHRVGYRIGEQEHGIQATWVVDTTGRRKLLAKQEALTRPGKIRHGSFYWWVDGLVDVEALSDLSPAERRRHPHHRQTGHLPQWLATNHFCDEGLWFWVIPLRGKTSLGLVFDHDVVNFRDVCSVEKATRFICERFPLFQRDLPHRRALDFGGFKEFSHECVQTLSPDRWAMSGEAGRFSDPLYSPGSDLIAIYNTLIVDAIETHAPEDRRRKCQTYESMMKAVIQAYMPTYVVSYDCLGDQECLTLKYVWELSIYFGVYVFPFINDLLTDRRFAIGFLRQFSRLGPWNRTVQQALSTFYQWKKRHRLPLDGPRFLDFMEFDTLRRAEKTFYQVGVDVPEAKRILTQQVDGFEELARFIVAHVVSQMLDEPRMLHNRSFVEALDLQSGRFELEEQAQLWKSCLDKPEPYSWTLDPEVLDRFRTAATLAERAS